jgi:hypothetical protein
MTSYNKEKWQVIYKMADGVDYCREAYASELTEEEVKKIADKEVRLSQSITQYTVEQF